MLIVLANCRLIKEKKLEGEGDQSGLGSGLGRETFLIGSSRRSSINSLHLPNKGVLL
jgi:hypothetical protein